MYRLLFTAYINQFDAGIAGVGTLAGSLADPFVAMATLYVMVWGYLIMTGRVQDLLSDTIARVVRVVIIGALVTNVGTYNAYVGNFFLNAVPCWVMTAVGNLGNAACGGTGVEAAGPVLAGSADQLWTLGWQAVATAFNGASIWTPSTWLGIAVGFIGALFTSVASLFVFFQVALIISVLKLVILLGPIFIALGLFERTSTFFMSWIGRVAHSLVELLLVALASQVLISIVNNAATIPATSNPWTQSLANLIGVLVSMALFLIVPSLAAALTGSGGSLTLAMVVGGSRALGAGRVAAGSVGVARGAAGWGASRFARGVGYGAGAAYAGMRRLRR